MERGDMSVKIFAMTHKKFVPPPDGMYVPLQVGRACHQPLGYAGDDTGDHISELNAYFSELTGVYWLWKTTGMRISWASAITADILLRKMDGCMGSRILKSCCHAMT